MFDLNEQKVEVEGSLTVHYRTKKEKANDDVDD